MSDVDNNSTRKPSGDHTRDILKIVGVAIGVIVLIYVAYIGSAVFQLMKLSDSYPITGIRSGAPAQVDRNYSKTPEVPIESIAAEAGLPAHYVVSSSIPGHRRFIVRPPEWRLCLCPFPPSERTVELVAGFGMAYSCPCLTMIRGVMPPKTVTYSNC